MYLLYLEVSLAILLMTLTSEFLFFQHVIFFSPTAAFVYSLGHVLECFFFMAYVW